VADLRPVGADRLTGPEAFVGDEVEDDLVKAAELCANPLDGDRSQGVSELRNLLLRLGDERDRIDGNQPADDGAFQNTG
jgi:hypothetical protein